MTLNRFPKEKERTAATNWLRKKPVRKRTLADILWAIVYCKEFIDRHR